MPCTKEITNSDDIIDSRDVIARIAALEDERQALVDAIDEVENSERPPNADENSEHADKLADAQAALSEWDDDDEAKELAALKALAEDAEGYAPDWTYGATLIRESYFVEYCRQLVSDIGDMPTEIPDYIVIDWDATADNLRADYTDCDYDGVTYLVR